MSGITGKTDADGDSHMDSSSSSDSDSMFPSEVAPTTPKQGTSRDTRFSNVHGSELSPPHSEERGVIGTFPPGSTENGGLQEPSEGDQQSNEPGWAWKNPKAQEEYQRSFDYVVDRNFNLREYGEIFDENEVSILSGLAK